MERVLSNLEVSANETLDFDDAATMDVVRRPLGADGYPVPAPAADHPDEDEVTARASVEAMLGPAGVDSDQTRRLHLSELERLVSASVDPSLDK